MKRTIFMSMIFIIIVYPCFALEIDKEELNRAKKVQFINYTGVVRNAANARMAENIGIALAKRAEKNDTARFFMKYSIQRASSPEEPEKLSADIFSIDRDAKVNHINMIRRILSSYIRTRFGYTDAQSDAIAIVTTYYNAIYRGDLQYIETRYKKVVIDKMNKSNVGLSTKYYEWPGRTKIIIPLSENGGGEIELFTAEDKNVTDELRKRPDRAIKERKELSSMKNEMIKDEKKEIDVKEKEMIEKKADVEKKEKEIVKEKEEVKRQKEKIASDRKKADELKKPEEREKAKKEIAKKEEETGQKEKEIIGKEQEIKKEKEDIKVEEKKVEEKKETIKKKEEDISKEKENIAEDERIVEKEKKTAPDNKESKETKAISEERKKIEKEKEQITEQKKEIAKKEEQMTAKLDKIYKDRFYYLKVNNWFNDGIYNNEMYIINPISRKVILKSTYSTIAGRKYDIFQKGVVIIGYEGKDKANFEHHLVLLDPDKLAPVTKGKDIIFWRSFIEIREGEIYCVLSEGNKYFLARYNDSLERTGQSVVEVDKDSVISFYGNFIYINSAERRILVLKKEDLSYVQTIDPGKDVER
jgi:hypothetical protein